MTADPERRAAYLLSPVRALRKCTCCGALMQDGIETSQGWVCRSPECAPTTPPASTPTREHA